VNRTHTSAALSAAGFLWLFALLFVVVIGTPVRVLFSSVLLGAAAMVFARLRKYYRKFQIPAERLNPAARENG
jgi:hypothetical protein